MDVCYVSLQKLQTIATYEEPMKFVWRNEGIFVGDEFQFNEESKKLGLEPIVVDEQMAKLMLKVFNMLKSDFTRNNFVELIEKDRSHFAMVLQFCFDKVTKQA